MNWVGGGLQRSKRSGNLTAKQKANFAKARARLLEGTKPERPLRLFEDEVRPQAQSAVQIYDGNAWTQWDPDGRADRPTSRPSERPAKRSKLDHYRMGARERSSRACRHHARPLSQAEADGDTNERDWLARQREKLLDRPDWLGLERHRPLQMTFPLEQPKVGRRREITEDDVRRQGKRRRGHAPSGHRSRRAVLASSPLQEEIQPDHVSVRFGTQAVLDTQPSPARKRVRHPAAFAEASPSEQGRSSSRLFSPHRSSLGSKTHGHENPDERRLTRPSIAERTQCATDRPTDSSRYNATSRGKRRDSTGASFITINAESTSLHPKFSDDMLFSSISASKPSPPNNGASIQDQTVPSRSPTIGRQMPTTDASSNTDHLPRTSVGDITPRSSDDGVLRQRTELITELQLAARRSSESSCAQGPASLVKARKPALSGQDDQRRWWKEDNEGEGEEEGDAHIDFVTGEDHFRAHDLCQTDAASRFGNTSKAPSTGQSRSWSSDPHNKAVDLQHARGTGFLQSGQALEQAESSHPVDQHGQTQDADEIIDLLDEELSSSFFNEAMHSHLQDIDIENQRHPKDASQDHDPTDEMQVPPLHATGRGTSEHDCTLEDVSSLKSDRAAGSRGSQNIVFTRPLRFSRGGDIQNSVLQIGNSRTKRASQLKSPNRRNWIIHTGDEEVWELRSSADEEEEDGESDDEDDIED